MQERMVLAGTLGQERVAATRESGCVDTGVHGRERHLARVVLRVCCVTCTPSIDVPTAASRLWLGRHVQGARQSLTTTAFFQCPTVLHHPFPIAYGL